MTCIHWRRLSYFSFFLSNCKREERTSIILFVSVQVPWCCITLFVAHLFVDAYDIGDVTVTNDGATILKMLEVEHPAAEVKEREW